jgi:hypothetical protein
VCIHNELKWPKEQICRLESKYVEELKKEAAKLEGSRRRKAENGDAWEQLLKNMNFDLTKFVQHQKADEEKSKEALRQARANYGVMPKDLTLEAKERINADIVSSVGPAFDGPPSDLSHWVVYPLPFDRGSNVIFGTTGGKAEGDCGIIPNVGFENITKPRAYSAGNGAGFGDSNEASVKCWFWYYISGEKISAPGTVYVWPYLDLHGNYTVRANDGWLTSKEAHLQLSVSTKMHRPDYSYAPTFTATILDKGSDNIEETGRVDLTGWNNLSKGQSSVQTGEPITVQVIAELHSISDGSGSHAELDFQTGEANYIRIPFIRVWVP